MYDPVVGQFLSTDPIEDDQENTYRYVGNDPLNKTDPTGLKVRHVFKTDIGRAEQERVKKDFDEMLRLIATNYHFTVGGKLARFVLRESTTADVKVYWDDKVPAHSHLNDDITLNPKRADYLPTGLDPSLVDLDGIAPHLAAQIVAVHEMGHALIDLLDPTPPTERHAANPGGGNVTLVENEFRQALGVKLRDDYDGQPIPIDPRPIDFLGLDRLESLTYVDRNELTKLDAWLERYSIRADRELREARTWKGDFGSVFAGYVTSEGSRVLLKGVGGDALWVKEDELSEDDKRFLELWADASRDEARFNNFVLEQSENKYGN